ncbi:MULTISPECIES: MFS transporter [unclassified Paenibacillus]|uniref:MFS transporter n=1 Tax=unclassified Paenibacillus TaxID=185978 RepID=UPI0024067410|nr:MULTISPECIES: MFS transporter [unclassified Paenibacillus]MDF9841755.1 YNFM family putative membrane transporter [Paenibacillus sp. PastF-2]MDF9848133.1 YNFM family putative membrane transporter [Paenibacillus sp. PastM-2]MDF9854914.1 YNFM family putative membrane transporter [Paenibacillus sp. PastF-1]MDH6480184.1 YNFM family putative membrane transporter [Paenibacillus sp. PastH-2]MDH6507614.1 YNFM family putative membrane transporter [Paenibacillus sp. PastM-3]
MNANVGYLERGSKEYRRGNLALFAAGLATFAILYSVQPLFPVFSNEFALSPAAVSLSLSISTIMLAISLPVASFLSDRVGRKSFMGLSLLLSSLCCLCVAFAPDFTSLMIIRAIQGVLLAGIPAVAMAYLSEETEAKSLRLALGLYISGNTVGGLFGRIAVSSITDLYSWRWGIISIALVSLLASLYFWRNLPPSRHFKPRRTGPKSIMQLFVAQFRDSTLVLLFLLAAILMGSFVTLYNYLGFRLIEAPFNLSQTLVGGIFILYLVGTFSSSWMGYMSNRIGLGMALWINIALMLLGGMITLSNHLAAVILGVAVFTFGFFGSHSTASSWVGIRASAGKAQASSLYLLFYYGGSSVGGSVGGLFWSRYGWGGIVGMISCLILFGAVAVLLLTVVLPKRAPVRS